jgi:hypothetical protein
MHDLATTRAVGDAATPARLCSIEEQIMEANNEFHRPLPHHDYAALHLTPEQAAKEAV